MADEVTQAAASDLLRVVIDFRRSLTNGERNRDTALSINHDELRVILEDARAAIARATTSAPPPPLPAVPQSGEGGERLAHRFHDTYERLAATFGYETRADTKAFDPSSPNGKLMIAVCSELLAATPSPMQDDPQEAARHASEQIDRKRALAAMQDARVGREAISESDARVEIRAALLDRAGKGEMK